jgi:hypothetical protein
MREISKSLSILKKHIVNEKEIKNMKNVNVDRNSNGSYTCYALVTDTFNNEFLHSLTAYMCNKREALEAYKQSLAANNYSLLN